MKLVESVPVPCRGVDHMDFGANGRFLIASCEFAATLVKVDVAARKPLGTLALEKGGMPQDVRSSPDGNLFYVADMMANGVYVIDPYTFSRVEFIPTGKGAHGISMSRDAKLMYVSNRGEGSVSVIDLATRKPIAKWQIPGGGSPDMGGLSADGTTLWLSGPLQPRGLRLRYAGWAAAGAHQGRERAARPGRLSAARPVFPGPQRRIPVSLAPRAAVVLLLGMTALIAASGTSAAQDLVAQARRLDLGGKQDAAIALYRQALEREPGSFDAHYGLARALDLAGSYADARRHFARAIELAPDGARDQALRMMAVSYVFTGDGLEAARYFGQVFDRHTATANLDAAAEVANELGRMHLELGDLENAARWYRTGYDTAARQPNRPAPAVDLVEFRWAHAQARIAARQGDAPEARRQEATAKRLLDTGTNPDQQSQYPYLAGYVHFFLKEYDSAAAELRRADQSDPFIMALLAQSYEKLGDLARAREYYGKALTSSSHAIGNAFARRIARQSLDALR